MERLLKYRSVDWQNTAANKFFQKSSISIPVVSSTSDMSVWIPYWVPAPPVAMDSSRTRREMDLNPLASARWLSPYSWMGVDSVPPGRCVLPPCCSGFAFFHTIVCVFVFASSSNQSYSEATNPSTYCGFGVITPHRKWGKLSPPLTPILTLSFSRYES